MAGPLLSSNAGNGCQRDIASEALRALDGRTATAIKCWQRFPARHCLRGFASIRSVLAPLGTWAILRRVLHLSWRSFEAVLGRLTALSWDPLALGRSLGGALTSLSAVCQVSSYGFPTMTWNALLVSWLFKVKVWSDCTVRAFCNAGEDSRQGA